MIRHAAWNAHFRHPDPWAEYSPSLSVENTTHALRIYQMSSRRKLESAEARKERVAQEQELAKAIAEDGDDGDF